MKNFHSNHNHTLRHPEALPKDLSRFFTTFRMTVCLSSLGLTAAVLACLLLSLPTQAKWGDNCTLNGGTIIQANQYGTQNGVNLDKGGKCNDPNNPDLTNNCNGMEFCMSNKEMNWWSAFTWCDSIGGKLASFEHLCPGTEYVDYSRVSYGNTCANMAATDTTYAHWGWTGTGFVKNKAIAIYLPNGATEARSRAQATNGGYALCEE